MPTLAEIRDSIISQVSGSIPSDDSRFEYGFIDKLIADKRSLLIKQQASMGLGIDQSYFQEMDCLTLSEAEVECEGESSGVIRRYAILPVVQSFPGAVQYLGTVDGRTSFQYKPYQAFIRDLPNRFCEPGPTYTIIGERAYVNREPDVRYLRLVAALADPASNKCVSVFEETPYPIPPAMMHTLELLVLKQLTSTLPIVPDTKNDAADSMGQSDRVKMNDK